MLLTGSSRFSVCPIGVAAFMFRLLDLQEGVVVYHHSGSDTTRDHVVFRVSDGGHHGGVRHRFPIRILPLDDSPPFLLAQRPLQVREGGSVRLGAESLLAADLDSSDDLITYRLEALPTAGQLVRRSSAHDPGKKGEGLLMSSQKMMMIASLMMVMKSLDEDDVEVVTYNIGNIITDDDTDKVIN